MIAVIGIGFVAALVSTWMKSDDWKPGRVTTEASGGGELHPVTIRQPDIQPLVATGELDAHGKPVMVACATCHDNRDPNYQANSGSALEEFHQGLKYDHGNQTCLSCHNSEDYNTLKQADGRAIALNESMTLCSQCHALQHRDYQNGMHGGMTGYWDLTRGGRTRNTCIDCHDPHHPKFPTVTPVFPPKPVIGENPATHDTPSSHHENHE
ncbi:hypothetical protein [Haloferula rosea]|uniref:Doubled CXXCH motif domain-containing protein n=1 Tax=Haloferula rosea TaxID=490093 RepID=A0A934VEA5_9BACT|nr:hypothetical protein [Haloferula rosea]MBK1827104.1 hypothetical protein [Haloferula rosea]